VTAAYRLAGPGPGLKGEPGCVSAGSGSKWQDAIATLSTPGAHATGLAGAWELTPVSRPA
jgi:hypothetical protein